jgi:hypothetical protein
MTGVVYIHISVDHGGRERARCRSFMKVLKILRWTVRISITRMGPSRVGVHTIYGIWLDLASSRSQSFPRCLMCMSTTLRNRYDLRICRPSADPWYHHEDTHQIRRPSPRPWGELKDVKNNANTQFSGFAEMQHAFNVPGLRQQTVSLSLKSRDTHALRPEPRYNQDLNVHSLSYTAPRMFSQPA